jgi:hypothetical protein
MMKEINLVGGDFDGKVAQVSQDVFDKGELHMFAKNAFDLDVDYMSGEVDAKKVVYRKNSATPHIWDVVY